MNNIKINKWKINKNAKLWAPGTRTHVKTHGFVVGNPKTRKTLKKKCQHFRCRSPPLTFFKIILLWFSCSAYSKTQKKNCSTSKYMSDEPPYFVINHQKYESWMGLQTCVRINEMTVIVSTVTWVMSSLAQRLAACGDNVHPSPYHSVYIGFPINTPYLTPCCHQVACGMLWSWSFRSDYRRLLCQ